MFSIIEMMEHYTSELEERLTKKSYRDRKLDDIALNMNPVNKQLAEGLNSFSDCRMAVMMMCVAESVSDCSLVEMIRKSASLADGEVIVVEEAWNSIIVAVGPNAPRSTRCTPVVQLLAIAERVIKEVRAKTEVGQLPFIVACRGCCCMNSVTTYKLMK